MEVLNHMVTRIFLFNFVDDAREILAISHCDVYDDSLSLLTSLTVMLHHHAHHPRQKTVEKDPNKSKTRLGFRLESKSVSPGPGVS